MAAPAETAAIHRARPARARVEDAHREHREERARHPERHRAQVDEERAGERPVGADEAQPLADRGEHTRLHLVGGALGALRELGRERVGGDDHRQAARGVDHVRGADPERGDEDAAERRPDHHRQVVQAEAERERAAQLIGRDQVRHDRGGDHVLERAEARHHARQHEQHRDRRRPRERHDRERGRARHEPGLDEQQQVAAVVAVGERAAPQRHRHQRDELDRAEQAGEERRVRERVDLERQRHQRGLRADRGHEVAQHQQPQIAGVAEGLRSRARRMCGLTF